MKFLECSAWVGVVPEDDGKAGVTLIEVNDWIVVGYNNKEDGDEKGDEDK